MRGAAASAPARLLSVVLIAVSCSTSDTPLADVQTTDRPATIDSRTAAERARPSDSAGTVPGGTCAGSTWTPRTDAGISPFAGKYAGLETLCGPALAQKLCELVTAGYRSVSYTEAGKRLRSEVDNVEGKVQGAYDGLWHVPSDSGLNIEHTWPQSKGASSAPASSDMHHLFLTRSDFNSARGNLPFGDVTKHEWPAQLVGDPACVASRPGHDDGCFSMRGRDAASVEVFEVRAGQRGASARAVFYFSIRYGSGCSAIKPLSVLDPSHPTTTEATLKLWNATSPPDARELERNDAVERAQGVRNPFIDHPELVERLSFQ